MTDKKFIISGKELHREMPNFNEYAFVVRKILNFLEEEAGFPFKMYTDEDSREEVWEVLTEDICSLSPEVQCLAHAYDSVETGVVYSQHLGTEIKFRVKPNVDNSVFYYPNYRVALTKINIYHNHNYMYHTFIFADNDQSLLEFYEYILKRQRDYLVNYVTVFTDKEDDVHRKKEHIENLVNREDVLMEEKTKVQIYRSVDEFFSKSGEFFKSFNIPYKRGILLYGKPGNGKTTLVKSIAGSISAPVVYWQITENTSSYSVSQVFETATKMAPMVLVIEDIDSMPEGVRSVFLNTLDGATSKEGIFLIGTTNYPERIDAALINRAGRFDRAYEIKLPTHNLRLSYLKKKGFEKLVAVDQFDQIAEATEGFSFAQLNELFTSAALQWHYENKVDIAVILEDLKGDNLKSKRNDWLGGSGASLGFRR